MKILKVPVICRAIFDAHIEVPDDMSLEDAVDFYLFNDDCVVPTNLLEFDGMLNSCENLSEFVPLRNLSEYEVSAMKRTMELINKNKE